MKQGLGKEEARRLYVEQQMTFDEIATRIGRSDKTVREWAQEVDEKGRTWKEQRNVLFAVKSSTHEELHELIKKLTTRMIRDIDDEKDISPQTLMALNLLTNSVAKLYSYEASEKKEKESDAPKDKNGLTPETRELLEREMGMM